MYDEPDFLDEATRSQLDILLRQGLAKDQDKLNYYRKVVDDPSRLIHDPVLRPYAAEILTTLLKILSNDGTVFNRTKMILAQKKPKKLKEEAKREALAVALRVIREGRSS
jgi:hypothetical protein